MTRSHLTETKRRHLGDLEVLMRVRKTWSARLQIWATGMTGASAEKVIA